MRRSVVTGRSLSVLVKMRLICIWCAVVAAACAQDDGFYAPQTFRQHVGGALFQPMHRPWAITREMDRLESFQKGLFSPAGNDVDPQASQTWRPEPAPVRENWRDKSHLVNIPQRGIGLLAGNDWSLTFHRRGGPSLPSYASGGVSSPLAPQAPLQPILPTEPWRAPFQMTKEQQAAILHHKQALTSNGAFRFEYASDNGLAAGEQIEPDGSRVGAYQYKDPSGKLVKLKYRAGKDGFQILEGSHLPKSPEPVAPPTTDQHYQQAYQQQRQQFDLQQQYNQQRTDPQSQQGWSQGQQAYEGGQRQAAAMYTQSWAAQGKEDDGQYRPSENEVEQNRGPHTFGEGYEFSFQG